MQWNAYLLPRNKLEHVPDVCPSFYMTDLWSYYMSCIFNQRKQTKRKLEKGQLYIWWICKNLMAAQLRVLCRYLYTWVGGFRFHKISCKRRALAQRDHWGRTSRIACRNVSHSRFNAKLYLSGRMWPEKHTTWSSWNVYHSPVTPLASFGTASCPSPPLFHCSVFPLFAHRMVAYNSFYNIVGPGNPSGNQTLPSGTCCAGCTDHKVELWTNHLHVCFLVLQISHKNPNSNSKLISAHRAEEGTLSRRLVRWFYWSSQRNTSSLSRPVAKRKHECPSIHSSFTLFSVWFSGCSAVARHSY